MLGDMDNAYDFSDLRATFINCTLKRSPEPSNTQGLVDISSPVDITIVGPNGAGHPRRECPVQGARHRFC